MSDVSKYQALLKFRNNFAEAGRLKKKLVDKVKENRKSRRTQHLNECRNFDPSPTKEDPALAKKTKIKLWKEERKKKMEEEAKKKRPPFNLYVYPKHTGTSPFSSNGFKFGAPSKGRREVRTKLASKAINEPFQFQAKLAAQKKNEASETLSNVKPRVIKPVVEVKPSGRTTRSQMKDKPVPTKPVPPKPVASRSNHGSDSKPTISTFKANKKPTAVNPPKVLKAPKPVPTKSTSGTLQKSAMANGLKKQEVDNNKKPVMRPLNAGSSVGRQNPSRVTRQAKERNTSKNDQALDSNNAQISAEVQPQEVIPHKTVSPPGSPKEPPNGPTFQRQRLQNETDRLKSLADLWARINDTESIPLNIKDEIDAVVGQTRLLLSKKFEQFRGLIASSQIPCQVSKTTPDDLDGFWEMMYLQVEQLDGKYKNLEDLKTNNWIEPIKEVPRKKRSTVVKPVVKNNVKSKFREIMAERRNAMKEKVTEEVLPVDPPTLEVPNGDLDAENKFNTSGCMKSPFVMRNILSARKSRSSMASVLTLRHSLLAKSIGSPARSKSPLAVPLADFQNVSNSLTPKVEFQNVDATPPASNKRLSRFRKCTPFASQEFRRRTRSMAHAEESMTDTSIEFHTPMRL